MNRERSLTCLLYPTFSRTTTPYLPTPPELDKLLAEIRQLTQQYKAGDRQSFVAFRTLVDRLLRLTVLKQEGGVTLVSLKGGGERLALGGWKGPHDPLPLNDGRYLRLAITLELAPTPEGARLKVYESSFQYQMDPGGQQWIFRYDYLRHPPEPHPGAHLQIRARLLERRFLRRAPTIERIHFPTSRVSLEAVIRLLVQEFEVPCNEPDLWRPALAESERLFFEIAHIPLSGPGHS